MTIQPTSNRVLILPDAPDAETKSGLIIPQDAQEKPIYGEVIMVGPDCRQVKVGDRAIFLRKSGVNPMLDGKEHIIMVEGDVLGVLEEDECFICHRKLQKDLMLKVYRYNDMDVCEKCFKEKDVWIDKVFNKNAI